MNKPTPAMIEAGRMVLLDATHHGHRPELIEAIYGAMREAAGRTFAPFALIAAAEALKADLIHRAGFTEDPISDGVWQRFCDALAAVQPAESGELGLDSMITDAMLNAGAQVPRRFGSVEQHHEYLAKVFRVMSASTQPSKPCGLIFNGCAHPQLCEAGCVHLRSGLAPAYSLGGEN
jgi:hypothetical protein